MNKEKPLVRGLVSEVVTTHEHLVEILQYRLVATNSVITVQFFLSKLVQKWMIYAPTKFWPEIQRIVLVLLTQVA